ncbi:MULTISPECIES: MetQ/NlpA family ABC transporter substrate-binding protein [unclassified Salinivibrio]|uniref:MetQ/NlpA family ABC transporter substrate-binding protein n=1 Tax=unclassified Salinivibrio TaxID=2636825 RepID=UPI00128E1904|nr:MULTISPECIES: MetQ/NlpA family ABC transporter substrate-binding protein [unclassified Salinivibrio]MPS31432.1 MetQ/NlpA family ABC transporter substrate-binding protein [Salinivibrio sp. VYel7]MPX92828.1 MetQ/NlpA family ABC transporter substrate-binding protein [Salinivibrio sp. VYel9]MPX95488.1 MetQ/NlpA family ABC transporter substrate-binding protein [Salinivibrio sp. VYel6]MPX99046.1 MetQ/NlpA family ABC transporter substrate-binding protein [Salinivibrio sp. VYel4]MPY02247.1 MetQ/Nlp
MKIKQLSASLAILLAAVFLSGCSDQTETIKIGATVGPHAQVVESVAEQAKEEGIDVEVVEFSDYISPNAGLADGSLDLNSYQHQPFLDNFNQNHDSELVAIGRSILMRMGIYSDKVDKVEALANGAQIAIPNDPTNAGRALLLLEDAGLITLADNVGFKATLQDVQSNPKQLEFVEVEAAQLPRSLQDVDAAAITMNYVMSSGLDPSEQGIFLESKDAPLAVMVVAVRKDDQDNPTYQRLLALFQSDKTRQFLQDTFNGTIEPAF